MKIKKAAGLLVLILTLAQLPSWAQETPVLEAFGGFSLLTIGDNGLDRQWSPGWQGDIALNVFPRLGFIADFGGQYETISGVDTALYEFLFGPRISARMEGATAFAHALIGGLRQTASISDVQLGSDTSFAMGFGGGVDLNMGESFAFRIFQIDWLPIRSGGEWFTSQVRFGIGFVLKTGQY